jgi:Condensation domain
VTAVYYGEWGGSGNRPSDGSLPLSYPQQSMWLLAQLFPTSYVTTELLHFPGVLDRDRLRAAVDKIVQRHEILRTVYRSGAGNVRQIVLPPAPTKIVWNSIGSASDSFVLQALEEDCSKPFDLVSDPALRVVVVEREGARLFPRCLHPAYCCLWFVVRAAV